MGSTPLRINTEVDLTGITGFQRGSESAAQAAARMAEQFIKSGLSAKEAESALRNLGATAETTAAAMALLGQSTAASTQKAIAGISGMDRSMAMAATRIVAMEGGAGGLGMALGRVAGQSAALGPLLAAAFPVIAAGAFVAILTEIADKVFKYYQNVVLLKATIDSLDAASEKEAGKAAELNYQYEIGNARLLEQTGHIKEATEAYKAAAAVKPLELPTIAKDIYSQFDKSFASFAQSVHTVKDADSVIARLGAEAASTAKQLQDAKDRQAEFDATLAESGGDVGGMALEMQRAAAEVEHLTKKYSYLQTAIGSIQSQTGISGTALEEQLNAIDKIGARQIASAQAYAEKLREAHEQDMQETIEGATKELAAIDKYNEQLATMHDQDVEATKVEAEKELRIIEEAARKELEIRNKAADEARRHTEEMAKLSQQAADLASPKGGSGLNQQIAASQAAAAAEADAWRKSAQDGVTTQQEAADRIQEIWTKEQNYELALIKKTEEEWQRSLNQIVGGPLESFITKVATGQERIGRAFEQMAAKMVTNLIEALAKMVVQWAEHWIILEVLSATGHATLNAQNAVANAKAVVSDAAKAAASAYANVPFPLNLVAAPAVFAAVMAFEGLAGSAEQGAIVPRDMGIFAHAEEMILPAPLSKGIQEMVGGGGGSAGAGRGGFTYAPTIHAIDGKSAAAFLKGNRKNLVKEMRRTLRNGGFARV